MPTEKTFLQILYKWKIAIKPKVNEVVGTYQGEKGEVKICKEFIMKFDILRKGIIV